MDQPHSKEVSEMEAARISPELPIRWVVSADRTVEIKEEVTELGCDQANERILQDETPPSSITERDPTESYAVPESEAQGPRIESVYTLEEPFHQEWCASLKQVTELTCVKDEEVPRLECVSIKEEFIEQECVPITEEVPTENNVCTLEENNQLGSSLCDDCPPECELGFRENAVVVLIVLGRPQVPVGEVTSQLEAGIEPGTLRTATQHRHRCTKEPLLHC
ncbi:UNVERIFIED_CONTAM: hypothetical protein FKN15_066335 [Acipenser sinensis]